MRDKIEELGYVFFFVGEFSILKGVFKIVLDFIKYIDDDLFGYMDV